MGTGLLAARAEGCKGWRSPAFRKASSTEGLWLCMGEEGE